MGKISTPQRILQAALTLFNASGVEKVSTNHIADEADLSPGNLYYHFKNKEAIIFGLFTEFEQELNETLLSPPKSHIPDLQDIWLFLHLSFEHINRYRFIYLDLVRITSNDPRISRRFGRLLARKKAVALDWFTALAGAGLMRGSQISHERLAEQIAMSACFWMSYQQLKDGVLDGNAAAKGVVQLLMLTTPFLPLEHAQQIEALATQYQT